MPFAYKADQSQSGSLLNLMSLIDNSPAGHVNLSEVGSTAMSMERPVRLSPPQVRRVAYDQDEERWEITVNRNHAL